MSDDGLPMVKLTFLNCYTSHRNKFLPTEDGCDLFTTLCMKDFGVLPICQGEPPRTMVNMGPNQPYR
jgi:hypothetical protein